MQMFSIAARRRSHTSLLAVVAHLLILSPAVNAEVSEQETALIKRRLSLQNVRATVSTSEIVSQQQFLDEYWVLGERVRVDNYLSGQKDALFYRGYRSPGEAVFFTNELNESGGDVVVEIRKDDPSVAQGDVRLLGLGIGTVRQPNAEQMFVIGSHKDSLRDISAVMEGGRQCTAIRYEDNGVHYLSVLDNERGFEPVRIETTFSNAGIEERHTAVIELQELIRQPSGTVHFPKQVTIEKVVDGVLKRKLVEKVEEIELDKVLPDTFSLPGLGIPVGHPVYDLRGSKGEVGHWNGAAVVLASEVVETATLSVHPAILAGNLAVGLFLAAVFIMRKRRRAISPSE